MIDIARVSALAALLLCAPYLLSQSTKAEALERYSQAGNEALAQGRFDEAEKAFEKLRELSPQTPEVYANLGLVYFQQKKFEQAVPTLRQALKLKPGLPKLDILLAMSLSELGHYKEAVPGLEKGLRFPDAAIKRMSGLQLLRAYTGLHGDSKAVETGLELNREYPNDPEVLYHTSRIYGNFAYIMIQKLGEVAPDSVWRHQTAAEAYESQDAYESAIGEYRTVLLIDPQRPGIHYRLGRTLLARERKVNSSDDTAAARTEFERELKIDPSNARAAYELGEIHRKSSQMEDAQKLFEWALKYQPEFEDAHLGLASTLLALQKPEQALAEAQKARALDASNEVAWYRLSLAYRALGNSAEQQKALAEFRRLKDQKSVQRETARQTPSANDVTKQELDSSTNQ